ncbi:Unknown protein [Striga hermonthica]|uniref:Uncharacterized protein n=1 Tax=Striga hermonthica TaxID=68872 RepID=A0A9N7RR93_STRHE|nr:Unknown protein [Striga hermonthica]
MIRAKVHRLRTMHRDFSVFLAIPGVMVHDDGGIVSVNQAYWAHVGEETDREVYFHWNGFRWYYACVKVFDEREAAEIDLEGGPGKSILDPIQLDDIESIHDSDEEDMDVIFVDEAGEPVAPPPAPVDVINGQPVFLGEEMEMDSDVESCLDSED